MPEQKISNILPENNKFNSQKWTFNKPIENVLIIKKINDNDVHRPFIKMIKYLISQKRKVFIETQVYDEEDDILKELKNDLYKFTKQIIIDLIITIGGDGTLLYTSSLFQNKCPPIMTFAAGSLGFLTKFSLDNFESKVHKILNCEYAPVNYRSRLQCKIIKNEEDINEEDADEFHVLNDVVIERNSYTFLSNVDLYINDNYITTIQGDGLIVATPTGSTAYSASTGASILHPSVQGSIITSICAHSLSFRPVVVPPNVNIKIKMAPESRNSGFLSLDGRHREELKIGYTLQITTSNYPVPTLLVNDEIEEFFESLRTCLNWNDRKKQKAINKY